MTIEITDATFDEKVLKSDKPIIIDFGAKWCSPCKMISPIIEELSVDYTGKAIMGKVNVDSNPNIAARYGIRNIPTILFIKNGEIVDKQVGAVPKNILASKLDAIL